MGAETRKANESAKDYVYLKTQDGEKIAVGYNFIMLSGLLRNMLNDLQPGLLSSLSRSSSQNSSSADISIKQHEKNSNHSDLHERDIPIIPISNIDSEILGYSIEWCDEFSGRNMDQHTVTNCGNDENLHTAERDSLSSQLDALPASSSVMFRRRPQKERGHRSLKIDPWEKAFIRRITSSSKISGNAGQDSSSQKNSRAKPIHNYNVVIKLTLAANFLDIPDLADLGCRQIAALIKGKTASEMRDILGLPADLTPKEEANIRAENAWAEYD